MFNILNILPQNLFIALNKLSLNLFIQLNTFGQNSNISSGNLRFISACCLIKGESFSAFLAIYHSFRTHARTLFNAPPAQFIASMSK